MDYKYYVIAGWTQTGTVAFFNLLAMGYLIAVIVKDMTKLNDDQKMTLFGGLFLSTIGWIWVVMWIAAMLGGDVPVHIPAVGWFMITGFICPLIALSIVVNFFVNCVQTSNKKE